MAESKKVRDIRAAQMEAKHRRQTAIRLQAPVHIAQSRFEKHDRVEGYYQDRTVPDFIGCDRLLKWDHQYGTIQLGFDPRRGQTFLFANIKTSILDTAAGAERRKMSEAGRMLQRKGEGPNRAYASRRRENSAVLLYNAENKPWSERSVFPYLRRANMETLPKTLPFLTEENEVLQRRAALVRDRELSKQEVPTPGNDLAEIRAERVELSAELNLISSLQQRKQSQRRLFFRRINMVYNLQKEELLAHYRARLRKLTAEAENLTADRPDEDENQ